MFKWFKRKSPGRPQSAWRESGHRRHARSESGPSTLHPVAPPADSRPAGFEDTLPHGEAELPWRAIPGKTGAEVAQSLVHSLHGPGPHEAEEPDTCSAELTQEHDLAIDILRGRRVIVISADASLRREVRQALPAVLSLRAYENMADARQDYAHESPHAVIYDGDIEAAAVFTLRHDPRGTNGIAYVEICANADDFSVSQFGSMSTGHVGRAVLSDALVPALVFELCKVDAGL